MFISGRGSFQKQTVPSENVLTSGGHVINDLQNFFWAKWQCWQLNLLLVVCQKLWECWRRPSTLFAVGHSEPFCELVLSNQISRECKQRQTAVSLWNVHRRKRKLSCSIWGKRKTRKKRIRECVDVSLPVTQSGNFVNGLMSQSRNVCKYCWCVWVFKADYWSSDFYQSFIF